MKANKHIQNLIEKELLELNIEIQFCLGKYFFSNDGKIFGFYNPNYNRISFWDDGKLLANSLGKIYGIDGKKVGRQISNLLRKRFKLKTTYSQIFKENT